MNNKLSHYFYYFSGILTVLSVNILFFLFLGYKIGFREISNKIYKIAIPAKASYKQILHLPDNILIELKNIGAVIEDSYNPTEIPFYGSFMVRPHDEYKVLLNPNVRASSYYLKTILPQNLEPPELIIPSVSKLSEDLENYLKNMTLYKINYSTDKYGFRSTYPLISSNKKILLIGDSVTFGVGVNDSCTIASYLQQLVQKDLQVMNTAIGGWSTDQIIPFAKRNIKKYDVKDLIYVICENDFYMKGSSTIDYNIVNYVIENMIQMKNNISGKSVVVLQTYLRPTMEHFYKTSTSQEHYQSLMKVKLFLKEALMNVDIEFIDYMDLSNDFMVESGSFLAPFSLYLDNVHQSKLGNRLIAESIFKKL